MYLCSHPAQTWRDLEAQLFEKIVIIPVYFAVEDSELGEIHANLVMAAKKEKKATAVEGKEGKGGVMKGRRSKDWVRGLP